MATLHHHVTSYNLLLSYILLQKKFKIRDKTPYYNDEVLHRGGRDSLGQRYKTESLRKEQTGISKTQTQRQIEYVEGNIFILKGYKIDIIKELDGEREEVEGMCFMLMMIKNCDNVEGSSTRNKMEGSL